MKLHYLLIRALDGKETTASGRRFLIEAADQTTASLDRIRAKRLEDAWRIVLNRFLNGAVRPGATDRAMRAQMLVEAHRLMDHVPQWEDYEVEISCMVEERIDGHVVTRGLR